MSNDLPVTLTDLTFDGADLQRADLSVHLDVVSGLNEGLRIRGKDTIVPGRRGRTVRNRIADGRDIILGGWIQGSGSTEADRLASYQAIRDELEELFDLEALPATLVGRAADGSWREIDARTVNASFDPAPVRGLGTLSIALDAAESDWQETGGGS